jgi:hypothetical protein
MSVSYSDIQPQRQTRNGLAIASLVLGIISIPTLGLLGVGAITAPAAASRDFVVCEDGIIYFVESKTPGVVNRGEGAAFNSSFYSR